MASYFAYAESRPIVRANGFLIVLSCGYVDQSPSTKAYVRMLPALSLRSCLGLDRTSTKISSMQSGYGKGDASKIHLGILPYPVYHLTLTTLLDSEKVHTLDPKGAMTNVRSTLASGPASAPIIGGQLSTTATRRLRDKWMFGWVGNVA